MKTRCNISTIAYSPKEWMFEKLDGLKKSGHIDFFAFIFHKAEIDERKDHYHLFIKPSQPIDTAFIDELLALPKTPNNDSTLGTCGIWHTVGDKNISDWILYVLHDVMYMRIKGYTDRKYTYTEDDFISSNVDGMQTLVFDAYHTSTFTFNRRVLDMILRSNDIKQTGKDLVLNGYIPLNSTCSFHHLLQIIQGG